MEWTSIIKALVELLAAIASAFLIPWLKTKWDNARIEKLTRYAEVGVAAAEQLCNSEQMQWSEKKKYVQSFLASKGYNVNLTEVDAAIESAVIKLHNELVSKP